MNKEINYPVKYAVLELKERGGWAVNYKNITQGFIASKCYVVGSNVIYHSDGSNKITHNVVFPYKDIELFKRSLENGKENIGKEIVPRYDGCNNVYPMDVVTDLFDTYEEAKTSANEKNLDYACNLSSFEYGPDFNERFKKIREEFEKRLEICDLFEQVVLEETANMDITKEISDDKIKVLKPKKSL